MRGRLWALSSVVLMVLVAAGTLGLAGCGCSTDSPSSPSASSSAEPTAIDLFSWSVARAHIGETAAFAGSVVGTSYEKKLEGHPTFLNVGVDYPDPDRHTVIIWEKDRSAFTEAPADLSARRARCGGRAPLTPEHAIGEDTGQQR